MWVAAVMMGGCMLWWAVGLQAQCVNPADDCRGPFHMRRSQHHRNYTTMHSVNMSVCVRRCHQDPCCRAFGLDGAGNCITTSLHTEELDFIIHSPIFNSTQWRDACMEPVSAACNASTVGVCDAPATPFTFQQQALHSHIRRVELFGGSSTIEGIGLRYDGKSESVYVPADKQGQSPDGVCDMQIGEKIVSVTTYMNKFFTLILGLELRTSLQTCGPYFATSTQPEVAEGGQLLYVSGTIDATPRINCLRFHFNCPPPPQ